MHSDTTMSWKVQLDNGLINNRNNGNDTIPVILFPDSIIIIF